MTAQSQEPGRARPGPNGSMTASPAHGAPAGAMRGRLKAFQCLQYIEQIAGTDWADVGEALQHIVNRIPGAWLHSGAAVARIRLDDMVLQTGDIESCVSVQSSMITVNGQPCGAITVGYAERFAEADEGPFLAEERALIEAIAGRLGNLISQKRSEAALLADRRRLHTLFSSIGDAVFMADMETGLVMDANPAALAMVGYARDELLTLHYSQLFPAELRADVQQAFASAEEIASRGELIQTRVRHVDGYDIPVEILSSVSLELDGRTGVIGTFRDISQRKNAERELQMSEERFRSFVENANDVVYSLTPQGLLTYVSPNWQEFMGEPAEEALGRSFEPYVHPEDVNLCRQFLEKTLATGEKQRGVAYRVRHQDGSWRWHVSNGAPLRDENDQVIGYIGIARDVTEAKQADEALRELHARIELLARHVPGVLYQYCRRPDGTSFFPFATAGIRDIFGISPEEARHDAASVFGVLHPEDRDRVVAGIEESARALTVWHAEYRVDHPDGRTIWVEGESTPRALPDGSILWHGYIRDVTERKRVEKDLRERELLLSGILDNLQDAYLRADLSGHVTYVNCSAPQMFGFDSMEDIIGLPAASLYANPADREALLHELRETGAVRDWVCLGNRADESTFWASLNAQFIRDSDGGIVGTEGVVRNISARKLAEEELRDRLRIETLVAELAARFVSVDAAHVDQAIEEALGQICECIGMDIAAIWEIPEDGETGVLKYTYRRESAPPLPPVMDARDYFPWVHQQVVSTGKTVVINDLAALPPEAAIDKETYVQFGCKNNITVPLIDADGQFFGAIGFNNTSERTLSATAISRLEMFSHITFDLIARTRSERALTMSLNEHEKLHAQFLQAQKMEAVGRLAGGVAHDFNNMLSVISLQAELAMFRAGADSPLEKYLQQIHDAANRSRDITRQLLAFARKQTISPVVLDLNASVESMLRILRTLIGESIDLAWHPGKIVWPVLMDPAQLDQVLANLCVNARDAIAEVGMITIETGTAVVAADRSAGEEGVLSGEYVVLKVSDDGSGIDGEILDKIFEPFFTTKGLGLGTGLGLSTVYGIIQQNNGFIDVSSEPERGTTFTIHLPRHLENATREQVGRDEAIPEGNGETVLVVEDEKSILELTAEILTRYNYNVLMAGTPAEALDVARTYPGEIALLITDVIMPVMNGRQLAGDLQVQYPGLKCIYMSGYTSDVIGRQGVLDEGIQFLQKPFSIRALAVKVRSVLEQ